MSSPDPKDQDKDLPAVDAKLPEFEDLGAPLPEQEIEVDLDSEEQALTPVEQELKDNNDKPAEGGEREPAPVPDVVVAELSERLEAVEQRVAVDTRAQVEARFKELDEQDTKADEADKAELEKLQKDMEAAYEKGDTKALAQLNINSQRVVQKQLSREEKRAQRKAAHERFVKQGVAPDGGEPGARPVPVPQAAQAWLGRNSWFNDRRYANETAAARTIDQGLAAEGFDKNTPEYYAELDKRLSRRFPNLVKKPAGGERRPAGPAPAVHQGGQSQSVASGGKVRLGPAEFAKMRTFNLDPKNPLHCRQYAAEIRNRLRREAAEGEG